MLQSVSLFRNARSGVFYIQYTLHGIRKQRSTRKKTRPDALAVLKSFLRDPEYQKPAEITLEQFREEYFHYSQGRHTPATQSIVRDGFRWFTMVISNRLLRSIMVKDLEKFITKLRIETSLQAARKHYITLKAAFQKAVEWGYLTNNPWNSIDRPKPPQTDAPFITIDDFHKVLSFLPNAEVRTIAEIAFHTGMRRGEILSLRWESVDFQRQRILLKNTESFTTKSKKQRAIPMNMNCQAAFKTIKQETESEGYIFSISPDYLQHHFKKACRQVFGMNTKLHFHSLRHSFCSNMLNNGANINIVQKIAGHSSISVTEKYAHFNSQDLTASVNLICRPQS